jgi:hypothetical protein
VPRHDAATAVYAHVLVMVRMAGGVVVGVTDVVGVEVDEGDGVRVDVTLEPVEGVCVFAIVGDAVFYRRAALAAIAYRGGVHACLVSAPKAR